MISLVIGASGQIGSHLFRELKHSGKETYGTYWRYFLPNLIQLDASDATAVSKLIDRIKPDVVYLTAALSNVDYCETHPDESLLYNVTSVRNIASTGVRIVFFSSDYVFDGNKGPYREGDPVCPVNVYGQHKVLAEQALSPDRLIIRTTVVYGSEYQGKNFAYRVWKGLKQGQVVRVPIDQIGNPTYAPNLARAVISLVQEKKRGIYHVVGSKRASRYEFALEIAHLFGLDNNNLIVPVTTMELKQLAQRPLNAGMLSEKIRTELPLDLVDYHAGLRQFCSIVQ